MLNGYFNINLEYDLSLIIVPLPDPLPGSGTIRSDFIIQKVYTAVTRLCLHTHLI